MGWDHAHGCWTAGANGGAEHEGDPLTVAEIAALEEGTEVVITWTGGNGPHRYRVSVDEHGERCVDTAYADPILRSSKQTAPLHRVTRASKAGPPPVSETWAR